MSTKERFLDITVDLSSLLFLVSEQPQIVTEQLIPRFLRIFKDCSIDAFENFPKNFISVVLEISLKEYLV